MKRPILCLAALGLAPWLLPVAAQAGVVTLGPVRIDQKDILDARNGQDPQGRIVVLMQVAPAAGIRVAKGLAPYEMKPIRIGLNDQALSQQAVETTDDGQLVTIHGPMTANQAATLALKLSGRPPAPTQAQE